MICRREGKDTKEENPVNVLMKMDKSFGAVEVVVAWGLYFDAERGRIGRHLGEAVVVLCAYLKEITSKLKKDE